MSAPPPSLVDFLRDAPSPAARAEAERLREELGAAAGNGDAARLRLLGRLGEALRAAGEPAEAVAVLERAVALAEARGDRALALVNRLRLGIARQYAGDAAGADSGLAALVSLAGEPAFASHRDFLFQHRGKLLAEMKRLDEARADLERALALRRAKGDAALVASTEAALAELARRRGGVT